MVTNDSTEVGRPNRSASPDALTTDDVNYVSGGEKRDKLSPELMGVRRRLDKVRRRLIDEAERMDESRRRLLKEAAEIEEEMKSLAA